MSALYDYFHSQTEVKYVAQDICVEEHILPNGNIIGVYSDDPDKFGYDNALCQVYFWFDDEPHTFGYAYRLKDKHRCFYDYDMIAALIGFKKYEWVTVK